MAQPRKSEFMHELSGTKSQATTPDVITPPGRPKFPKDISPELRPLFKRVCGLLEQRRALTAGDGELILLFVVTYARWKKALSKIQEQGEVRLYTRLDSNGTAHDVEKTNLWLPIAEKAEKSLVGIIDRLGLTPLNRSKVKPTGEAEKPKADPTFEESFFAGLDTRSKRTTFLAPPVVEEPL
jgi:P27 family predicted phage terminase small subunit